MKKGKLTLKRVVKDRARRARKVKSGANNHAMGNVVAHMHKTGAFKRSKKK